MYKILFITEYMPNNDCLDKCIYNIYNNLNNN